MVEGLNIRGNGFSLRCVGKVTAGSLYARLLHYISP